MKSGFRESRGGWIDDAAGRDMDDFFFSFSLGGYILLFYFLAAGEMLDLLEGGISSVHVYCKRKN